jgi:hypothetical protein
MVVTPQDEELDLLERELAEEDDGWDQPALEHEGTFLSHLLGHSFIV